MATFENILISERKKRGLSLRDASAQIGICHTYLSALEKGGDPRTGNKVIPSQEVLFKICKAYDLNITDAIPFFNFHDKYEFFIFIAKQIKALKCTNPRKYKEIVNIITQEE